MSEEPRRRPGRPATGQTPVRTVRIGKLWEEAETAAQENDEGIREFVERALRDALVRHRRRRGHAA